MSGKAWVDDDGPFYPLITSLLWGLGGWMKGGAERDRVKFNLDDIAFRWELDGARIIYDVRWAAQPYGADIIGTPEALAELLDCAHDDFGLRLKVTVIGGGAPDPKACARGVVQAVAGRQQKVLLLEGVNEGNASRADAVAIGKILKTAGVPCAVGYGNQPLEDEIIPMGNEAGTNVDIVHLERTNADPPAHPSVRRDRQCWDFHHCKRAGDNGEFAGPGSSVAVETSPFHLAVQRAGGIICGAESYCLHTGSGVYGVRYDHSSGPRYANLREIPNIDAMMLAVRNVDKAIKHTGIGNWAHFNTPIPMEVTGGNIDKQYFARTGKEFVAILTDARGSLLFKQNEPIAWWKTFSPTGDEVDCRTANLRAYVLRGAVR